MKKQLALFLAVGLMAGSLAACGGKPTGSPSENGKPEADAGKQPVSLSFAIWDKNQKPAMQAMADAYVKENPHVKIDIQLTPYKGSEYWTKLETAMTAGTAPDVFWVNALHIEKYVDAKMVEPLDETLKTNKLDLSQFPQALVKSYNYGDKQYAVPKDFDTNAVWYNKKIFDANKVPYPQKGWTWDEFVATAKKLTAKENGIYGTAAPLDFQTCYYNTVFAAGGWILDKDKKKAGYTDPKTQEGIQCWINLLKEGISPSFSDLNETSADAMFENGKLAMCWAGSYMTPEYVKNSAVKDDIDLVEAPSFKGKEANVINGLGYAVFSGSKHKAEAEKFAAWLGGNEAMAIQGNSGAVISARKDAQNLFEKAYPKLNMKAYLRVADIATALPVCKNAAQVYDLENKYLKQAFAGEKTLAQACEELQKAVDDVLSKMK